MKLLAGVHQPDAGQIVVNGRPTVLNGPMDARHAGISTVFQELTVLPNLTVGENLMLGREPRRVASHKRYLAEHGRSSPLFDVPQIVRDIETEFERLALAARQSAAA